VPKMHGHGVGRDIGTVGFTEKVLNSSGLKQDGL